MGPRAYRRLPGGFPGTSGASSSAAGTASGATATSSTVTSGVWPTKER